MIHGGYHSISQDKMKKNKNLMMLYIGNAFKVRHSQRRTTLVLDWVGVYFEN
jgi:hypothetical protein